MRYGSDTWDSLPAESHAASLIEILKFFNLAGGVVFRAEGKVGTAHAGAVIVHFDESHPTADDLNPHGVGSGIDAVFDEFLDDGSRPLHHFPGRHTTRQRIIHQMNSWLFNSGFW